MSSPTLFLIDGSSQMYRAYHAIRGLSGPDGKSTNAVYGFVTMLRKLLADHQPTHIAASFDLAGPTFRDQLAADYKANRTAMPDDLAEQIPWVHEACEALGVPIITQVGFEADDVIGTLARRAVEVGARVAVVTGDKDFFQLVDDHVRVFNPRDEGTWYDQDAVKAKWGVQPEQVVDVLALMGDSIDNIKGVPGIGEKGAKDLIGTWGSLDTLLAHANEVPQRKYREALLAHAEDARQSRELLRIRTDVEVPFDLDQFRFRGASRERCYELFSRLQFRSLVMEYAPTADAVDTCYDAVTTDGELAALVDAIRGASRLALRVLPDTPIATRAGIAGLALAISTRRAWYIPLQQGTLLGEPGLDVRQVLDALRPLLEDERLPKIGHDLKADALVLARQGVALKGLAFDTMLASYLLDPTRSAHGLEDTALEHLGYKALSEEDVCGKGVKAATLGQLPLAAILTFAGERADLALQLADALQPAIERERLARVYSELEMPLVPVLVGIEQAGIRVDGPALAAQSQRIESELALRSTRIYELAGVEFNINSPKQLADVLFEKLQLPVGRRTGRTKAVSTAVEVLEELALTHELPRLVLEWRALQKLKGTYIDALPQLVDPATGRVHTSFNQAVAATGRLSSSDPNLQNIPIQNGARTGNPPHVHRRRRARPHFRRLLADRASRARPSVGRRNAHRSVQARRRHSRSDRDESVRARKWTGSPRAAAPREDHQLRAALWKDRVHARQGHRRDAAGGAGLHRCVLRGISARARLHRHDPRPGPRHRRREDDVRATSSGAGAHEPQRRRTGGRGACDRQHAHPGIRRRHPQARHDRRGPRARRAVRSVRSCGPDDPHRARRTTVRGSIDREPTNWQP